MRFSAKVFHQVLLLLSCFLFLLFSPLDRCDAAPLLAGEILVTQRNIDAIFVVDPMTGDRAVFSQAGVRGLGPNIDSPNGIVVTSNHTVYATSNTFGGASNDAIFRIDPVTGDRTLVSQSGTMGSGIALVSPRKLAIESDGSILVLDTSADAVIRVDPVTGDRTVLSQVGVNGTGPTFAIPRGITVDSSGNIFVADDGGDQIIRVDPVTGDRTVISRDASPGPQVGGTASGTSSFFVPLDVAVDSNDALYAFSVSTIIEVDPITGFRSAIPSNTGPSVGFNLKQMTVDLDGNSLVFTQISGSGQSGLANSALNGIIKFDPVTGLRTTVSSSRLADFSGAPPATGSGPLFDGGFALAVVPEFAALNPVPEPSSLALLATGAIGLIGYRRRKRKQAA